ncbi:hypothetical protein PybrP1_004293 [[Pythium] brassicae (nom. inval.)]|nr:hypothetical protein PybrP1_004293 [[Pythium] brassicae (nom. inval.)]
MADSLTLPPPAPTALRIGTSDLQAPPVPPTVTSPRNEFFVSQRAADYELSKLDTLSIEEQEILSNIQELQLQLMQLRAEEDEDSEDEAAPSSATAGAASSQLIVVSNSLPVLLERVPQTGRWKATKTTGGLDKLMCLTGVRNDLNFLWVGWVGQHIPKAEHESVRRLLLQHNCLPVFLSSEVANRHNGFSAEVLWSLFHYVSEPMALAKQPGANASVHAGKRFNKQEWRAYESANESFADAIAEIYNEGDSVWIHDYHLMLLPSLLRQRIPLCHIGWFLHTPFPSSDVYGRLPVRSQLLTGVLQADLVGFQTFDYERHFLSTCQRLLGVDCSHKGIRSTLGDRDHTTSIGVFPIGISVEPFARAAASWPTLNRVSDLQRKFGSKRIILGVDRLDNIKGIPHKLLAMEVLLSRFPEWQHNVVLIQIGISSRSGVVDTASASPATAGREPSAAKESSASSAPGVGASAKSDSPSKVSAEAAATAGYDATHQLEMSTHGYKNLLSHVNQLVGRINGTYGSLDYAPIHFIHQRETPHEELCALYNLADVCLVTSTRDGMNLVSHEFVVCQQHFMRRKEDRKKAVLAAVRGSSNSGVSSVSGDSDKPHTGASSKDSAVPSPQLSPTKILTDWEGENGGPGVLVLSEFAGSSQSLSGAIVINPWNTEDLAASIHQALSMSRIERELRQQKLYRYVSSNTATSWSMQFLGELGSAVQKNREKSAQLPKLDLKDIVQAYRTTTNRVIILDYDRTLTPQHSLLPLAAVGPNFKSLLDSLSADESNTVFILSARERKFLETWLNGVRVGVAAEDGFFYRMNLRNDREQWKTMSKFHYDSASARAGVSSNNTVDTSYLSPNNRQSRRSLSISSMASYSSYGGGGYNSTSSQGGPTVASSGGPLSSSDSFVEEDSSWKDLVLPVMVNFTDRTPGSYIEDKESSLTWYYGDADQDFGGWQAKDLQIILERQLIGTALEVYQGHKYVSVEHEGCTKTKVLEGILKHLSLPQQIAKKKNHEVDFVLCVCDDVTDDQMFQTLNTLVTESNERHEHNRKREEEEERAGGTAKARSGASAKKPSQSQRSSAAAQKQPKKRQPATVRSASESSIGQSRKAPGASGSTADENDPDAIEEAVDEDNKVAFSRLHKVPVRMAENVSIFTVVVGPDVQHSGGHHGWSFGVDSLSDIRKVLKEFVDASRKAGAVPPTSDAVGSKASTGSEPESAAAAGVATDGSGANAKAP